MFKHLTIIAFCLLALQGLGQNIFESGYFIDENNERKTCLIQSIDWVNNPSEFSYKLSGSAELQTATTQSVKEFGIDNSTKYVRAKVDIDRSSDQLGQLSWVSNPVYSEEVLFLKVLIEGSASLYQYTDKALIRYFFKTGDMPIAQLVYKPYLKGPELVGHNNQFRQQIFVHMSCEDLSKIQLEHLEYKKKDLVRSFKKHNSCQSKELSYAEPKVARDRFNLSLRPRVNRSTLTLRYAPLRESELIIHEPKVGFGLGLEFEFILPINKDKWAFVVEPTYQSFVSEKTLSGVQSILGGSLSTKLNYSSIELPLTARYYILFNEDSKLFLDASIVFDTDLNSTLEYKGYESDPYQTRQIQPIENFAIGIGYRYHNRLSLQLRYQDYREILADARHDLGNLLWSSDYRSYSVVFGYTFL